MPSNEDLGKIEEIMLNTHDDGIAYAVLSVPREKLQNAPGFPKNSWPDANVDTFGVDIYEYYGAARGPRPYGQGEPEAVPPASEPFTRPGP